MITTLRRARPAEIAAANRPKSLTGREIFGLGLLAHA
jgi:hypothetical protein